MRPQKVLPASAPVPTQDHGHEPVAARSFPSYVFDPSDPWTLAFQAGLERAGLEGSRVYEVGVGSGANVLFMLRRCRTSLVLGSDLDARLTALAGEFVAESAPDLAERFQPIEGSVNLIDSPAAGVEAALADTVVACLPQVPDPEDAAYARFLASVPSTGAAGPPAGHADDRSAHYYPWTAFHDHPFNAVGLGLIEALLGAVRDRAPRARVVLNLGCRVGKDTLLRLFRAKGYEPQELASRIVRQDPGTDISFFVALEAAMRGTGHGEGGLCEFYATPDGRVPLSAREAKDLLDSDPDALVFHEVCVLLGRPVPPPPSA